MDEALVENAEDHVDHGDGDDANEFHRLSPPF
jgi:hypothetical protein